MAYRKRLRIVSGIVKDKGSLIKTTLSTKRHKSSVRRVILRATTHNSSSSPPSDNRIAAVIALGDARRSASSSSCTCIQALMDRLHGTSNASVALKCLFIIHNIMAKGSFVLKDQLSVYPSFGGRNFLNLSMFRDGSDSETLEMSTWVRWYATILEQNMMVAKVLGYQLSSSSAKNHDHIRVNKTDSDLLNEVDVLVNFVEHFGNAPSSLYLQRKSLVYEVVRSVSDDLRLVQREISVRVSELGARMKSWSCNECTQFLKCLKRFEESKERITLLLVNRNRNDDLRDLVKGTKAKLVVRMDEEKVGKMLVIRIGDEDEEESTRLTRFNQLFRSASRARWAVDF